MPETPSIPPDLTSIVSQYKRLAGLFSMRNMEFAALRRAFAGSFASNAATNAIGLGDTNDRKRISYNLINFTVRRFMDEMSSPHRIEGIPNGIEPYDNELAEKRAKALDCLREEQGLDLKLIKAAYNQSLLDKAVFIVRPDPKAKYKVRIELVTPECYYPIPYAGDWAERRAAIISWRRFDINAPLTGPRPETNVDQNLGLESDRIIEYWDHDYFVRVENGVAQPPVKHGCGDLFEEAHNLPIPDQHRGQGDTDQVLGLNEGLNEAISDAADTLSYLANPIVVVRGSRSGTQGLTWGPRAIWNLERDGSAEILTWAGAPPTFEAHILRLMQGIEDGTGLSSPAFGREIPSGVSGEAVRSILSGFNTRVGTKQQLMALSLASLYRKVQKVWETAFPNWEIPIPGERPGHLGQGSPDSEGTSLKPKDFRGHYSVRVIFEPQNETVKVFTELQKLQAGTQSRLTTMKRLGIINPEDEYRRVILEKMFDAQLQLMASGAPQAPGMGMPGAPGMPGLEMDPRQRMRGEPDQPMGGSTIEDLAARMGSSNPGQLAAELTGMPGIKPGGRGTVKLADILEKLERGDFEAPVRTEGQLASEGEATGRFKLRVQNTTDAERAREALGVLASRADIIIGDASPVDGESIGVARPKGGRRKTY